jgi:hypothetical protein
MNPCRVVRPAARAAGYGRPRRGYRADRSRSNGNLGAAMRFAIGHADDLRDPAANEFLRQRNDLSGLATLALINEDQMDLAYRLLGEPEQRTAILEETRTSGSPVVLGAVATLILAIAIAIAEERELQLRALTQLAIARAASGELTQAIDLIEQVRDANETTTPIVIDLTDAIQRFPEHSADLAQLIQVVAAPPSTED